MSMRGKGGHLADEEEARLKKRLDVANLTVDSNQKGLKSKRIASVCDTAK